MMMNRLCVTSAVRSVLGARTASTFRQSLSAEMDSIREAGTFKTERIITTPMEPSVSVKDPTDSSEHKVTVMCANNYLGLSNHPEVVEAGISAIHSHGFGLSSVRFICGTQDIHRELEHKIAEFHGMDDAILYPSCFDANAGLFEVICSPEDAVISDELNHASIIDGIRLCKAQRHRYKHMDLDHLESILKETHTTARNRLIVTDGVFSMDGDIAPLAAICDLADAYDAEVFIDECHATGFLGETGRGTDEHTGTRGRVDIINSTLGKALGGATGGYTTGPQEVVDLLRQRARPYLFSNSVAPSVVGASLKVFDMLMSDSSLVTKIRDNTVAFRKRMTDAGFTTKGDPFHPIVPVMLYDARLANEFADQLLKQFNVYVIGFSYPVVPKDQARIRVQVSAGNSMDDIHRAADAFEAVGKQLGVL